MIETTIEAPPSERECLLARESNRALMNLLNANQDSSEGIRLQIGNAGQALEAVILPTSALRLMTQLLAEMAQGHAVALMPVERELSTFEAAEVLNVSRPYLIKLLEAREIPFRRVGTHRRVVLRDLLEYKRADDAKRALVLDDLTAEAQELEMGY